MKAFALAMLFGISLTACATDGHRIMEDDELEAAGWAAMEVGAFGQAIGLLLHRAQAGDSEAEFTIGFLALLWLEAETPSEAPRYSLEDALTWIRKAAAKNLPQAAGFLRSGYEWGRYTMSKSAKLEECWRRGENGEHDASVC